MKVEGHLLNEIYCHRYAGPNPRYALLISHGIGGHGGIYDVFCEQMAAKGVDLWSYDAPGHGRSTSTRPRGQWTLEEWSKAGADFAEHIATECKIPVFVLGSSLGGGAAYGALASSAAVLGGVFMGSVALPGANPHHPFSEPGIGRVLELLGRAVRLDIATLINFDEDYGYSWAAAQKLLDPYNTWSYDLASFLTMGTYVPAVPLSENRKPILLTVGENDPFAPPARVRELCDKIGGPTTFHQFDGASHQLMLFHTTDYARFVHDWCLEQIAKC